jgi:arylsulfatase A-like enzyme
MGRGRRPARGVAAALLVPAAFLLSAAPLLHGCAGRRFDARRPDVVLIVVDTLRADHLGAYGYGRDTSPAIDALARRSTLFENAWAAAPWTLPSVMSITTGRYPSGHRVENDGLRLGTEIPTLAEILKGAGYGTGGFVSHVYVDRPYGFERGFGRFEDFGIAAPSYRPEAGLEPTADRVTDAALAWLARQGNGPIFLFVHYFDPHWPYAAPGAYRDRYPSAYRGPLDASYDSISKFQAPSAPLPEGYGEFLVNRYDGEIRFVDDQIGRLLAGVARAGRDDRAWIVLTADHGEEFKDHGSMGHGRRLYEETIRVPLLVRAPAAREVPAGAASRVQEPVTGVDLFPTIAAFAGVRALPEGLAGRDLAPLLGRGGSGGLGAKDGAAGEHAPPAAGRTLVSETVRLNSYRKAVRQGALKLIQSMGDNRSELYDLAADPGERRDLAAQRPEDRRRLLRALYSEVDLLSGGWNLVWSSDGRPRRFRGRIRTTGIVRSVVPLFPESGKYVIERGDSLEFEDAGQTGESGLAFTVAPPDAPVTFTLAIDGRPVIENVFLGGQRARPREMPFTLPGRAAAEAAFARPKHAPGREIGFYLWRNRPARPDQAITLDEEIRERLRSLGYVD